MDINSFFLVLNNLTSGVAVFWIFVSSMIVLLFLNAFYVIKKRKKSITVSVAVIVFEGAILVRAVGVSLSVTDLISILTLSVFSDMIFSFAVKVSEIFKAIKKRVRRKITVDLKSFIPVDKEVIKKDIRAEKPVVSVNTSENAPDRAKEDYLPKTDYSHVRSIIEKLSFYQLNAQERKSVNDLKTSVISAENGDDSAVMKERISEGLGGLLKIMAKYNV